MIVNVVSPVLIAQFHFFGVVNSMMEKAEGVYVAHSEDVCAGPQGPR